MESERFALEAPSLTGAMNLVTLNHRRLGGWNYHRRRAGPPVCCLGGLHSDTLGIDHFRAAPAQAIAIGARLKGRRSHRSEHWHPMAIQFGWLGAS